MKLRLEIIGTIGPSACYAAVFVVSFFDESIRLPVVPSIVLCLVCVAMIIIGVVERKDWRPLRKNAEAVALCLLMVTLFVPVLFILGIMSLMMFGLEGTQ